MARNKLGVLKTGEKCEAKWNILTEKTQVFFFLNEIKYHVECLNFSQVLLAAMLKEVTS